MCLFVAAFVVFVLLVSFPPDTVPIQAADFNALHLFSNSKAALTNDRPNAQKTRIPQFESVFLKVENIPQLPELPNGCEATSLSIVLRYWGHSVTKTEVSYQYMPSEPFSFRNGQYTGPHPESKYPGDPGMGTTGFYCYPPVVVKAAETYFAETSSHLAAQDISGADLENIFNFLADGNPVIVWKTIHNTPLEKVQGFRWLDSETNELYEPYQNIHVVVVTGYDKDFIYLNDPLQLYSRLSLAEFEQTFHEVGRKAVVLFSQ